MNTFEKELRWCAVLGILGGVTIAGLALAPFTLGASVALAGLGSAIALGGGIGSSVATRPSFPGIVLIFERQSRKVSRDTVCPVFL